ncbi:MAG: glycosyltransferase family 4 protein [Parvibaculaceae bacterium]
MRLAFYAPLKPHDHAVPSGDRQMARALIQALTLAGFDVEVASRLRTYRAQPEIEALKLESSREQEWLLDHWRKSARPDLWLTYHPYYRAPDLIGPALARALSIPYVTIEASHAGKRDRDAWRDMQAPVAEAVRRAALNICLTRIDREGLERLVGPERLADLAPFIDVAPFRQQSKPRATEDTVRLVTVAMMRQDAKLDSYRILAHALGRIISLPWHLTVVGDGPAREAVVAGFAGLDPARIEWLGQQPQERVAVELALADLFVWPGIGEAYGLVYLEAQAAGLPVVAMETHGVPMVVRNGETGILAPAGDVQAYADAMADLIGAPARRVKLGAAGRDFVVVERSLEGAARNLSRLLSQLPARPASPSP